MRASKDKKNIKKAYEAHSIGAYWHALNYKVALASFLFVLAMVFAGYLSISYAMNAPSTHAKQIRVVQAEDVKLDNQYFNEDYCSSTSKNDTVAQRAAKVLANTCETVNFMVPVADRLTIAAGREESLFKVDLNPSSCLTDIEVTAMAGQYDRPGVLDGGSVGLYLKGKSVGKYQIEDLDSGGSNGIWGVDLNKVSADYLDLKLYGDKMWKLETEYVSVSIEMCPCKQVVDVGCGLED